MTRVGVVADIHVGNHRAFGGEMRGGMNDRCRLALSCLEGAVESAYDAGCDALVLAGDVVDRPKTEPQVLAAVRNVLAGDPVRKFVVKGNHDASSDAAGDNALGTLRWPEDGMARDHVVVIDEPSLHRLGSGDKRADLILVPFKSGRGIDNLRAGLEQVDDGGVRGSAHRLLVFHYGIVDADTPPWLRDAEDAVALEEVYELACRHGIEAVAAGNWHSRRVWARENFRVEESRAERVDVCQVGTLCPTGWDNPGMQGYGTLLLWEPGKRFRVVEIPGPRFVNVADLDTCRDWLPSPGKNRLHVRVLCAPGELARRTAEAGALVDEGLAHHVRVEADRKQAADAAAGAAEAVAGAATTDEAVAAWFAGVALDEAEEPLRARALAETRRLLTEAA